LSQEEVINKEESKPKEVLKRINVVQTVPREWEQVESNPDKILEIINQNHLFREAFLKKFKGKNQVSVKPATSKTAFYIETVLEVDLSKDKDIILYKYAKDQHYEIIFDKIYSKGKIHNTELRSLRIGKRNRRDDRFSTKNNPVYANNFLVAKIDLDIKTALGFSTEVIFSEVDKTLKDKYPRSKVTPLFNRDDLSVEEELLLTNKKSIYITNTLSMTSSTQIDCVNLKEFYEDEFILDEKKAQFRKENIYSFVYYPIIFKSDDDEVVIGYCYNEGNSEISIGNIEYFQVIAETIITRIMDSSTTTIEERQTIMDISERGVLIEVRSDYIRDALKKKPSFSMDVIFKMIVPMRLSLHCRHIYTIDKINYIGADITGSNTDEKGIEKYREIVRSYKP
jgi:predicted nucleic acid-binding protein